MMNIVKIVLAAVGAFTITITSAAHSQNYPAGQISMIVPFEAGGGSDRVARTIDEFWAANGNQSFNFQYFPGAGGAVGASRIAESLSDGYTIGIVNFPDLVLQQLSGAGTFDVEAFDYVGQVNSDALVIMVPENSPYETFGDFLAAAQEAPGQLTFAVSGTLGAGQIVAHQLGEQAGAVVTLVPTQGGANTVARVAGGHVSAGSIGLGLFLSQNVGRALAVTSAERSPLAPDLPAVSEFGVDIDVEVARIVVGPEGLSKDALAYLRSELSEVVGSEGFQEASKQAGLAPVWRDGTEVEDRLPDMVKTYQQAVEAK